MSDHDVKALVREARRTETADVLQLADALEAEHEKNRKLSELVLEAEAQLRAERKRAEAAAIQKTDDERVILKRGQEIDRQMRRAEAAEQRAERLPSPESPRP